MRTEPEPKPGSRWHKPRGGTSALPGAKSVKVVAVIDDPEVIDEETGGPLRLVVYKQWLKRGRYHSYGVEEMCFWHGYAGWAKGPLPRAKQDG